MALTVFHLKAEIILVVTRDSVALRLAPSLPPPHPQPSLPSPTSWDHGPRQHPPEDNSEFNKFNELLFWPPFLCRRQGTSASPIQSDLWVETDQNFMVSITILDVISSQSSSDSSKRKIKSCRLYEKEPATSEWVS